jgi:hypothetical protein
MKRIIQFWMIILLIFITYGCEREMTKLPELTKPIEQSKKYPPLHEAALAGDIKLGSV